MNRTFILLLLIILPLIIGMSSFNGEKSPEKIPIPAKKINVTFIDQMDVITECKNASIEGNTFLDGKVGNGNYIISLDNINFILFYQQGDELFCTVKLNDDNTIKLSINKAYRAYGQTKYGSFRIKLSDLKKMIIERRVK